MSNYSAHPQAIVESQKIGRNTRLWAFCHVLPGAVVGEDCNLCDHTFVENDVLIGNRVTVKSGVQLWDGITLEDDVFVGPNATFTNDPFPRSKRPRQAAARTIVKRGASIGANATILPGIIIGQHAMVGAGSVVPSNVSPLSHRNGQPGTHHRLCADGRDDAGQVADGEWQARATGWRRGQRSQALRAGPVH